MENLSEMGFDPKIYDEILKHFEKIKSDTGIEPDDDYQRELENILGAGFEDLEEEIYKNAKTRFVEVEVIDEDAVFPKYSYETDSGFDLHSTKELEIGPFGRVLVPTGIKVSFEEGYELQVRPKSGLAINQGLTVLNTPGTVDQGYTGEIQVIVFNTNNHKVVIPKGMKVAQAVLARCHQGVSVDLIPINEIVDKDRNENGFGSTGI